MFNALDEVVLPDHGAAAQALPARGDVEVFAFVLLLLVAVWLSMNLRLPLQDFEWIVAAAAKPMDEWLLQVIATEVAMREEAERRNQELQVANVALACQMENGLRAWKYFVLSCLWRAHVESTIAQTPHQSSFGIETPGAEAKRGVAALMAAVEERTGEG
jgi:hypothetical protein